MHEVLPDRAVVAWYAEHARPLPWREPGTSPYAVLVSEVMSQQTPVDRVIPAWREWMRRWPDAPALAAAHTGEVLLVWGRLGYPRRALRLVEAAQVVTRDHGGELPRDVAALRALPGVGDYTAGAVMAFAYGERALTLDTNVRRVLARADAGVALPAPHLARAERDRAEELLPAAGGPVDPARWSVAVMELGALVCTAKDPRCEQCPWQAQCAWLAAGKPADEHASRRRTQAWHGTDRQARGLIMARLRESGLGEVVAEEDLLLAASGARRLKKGMSPDPDQPARALAGLEADGLIVRELGGFRLPS